jgi:hypothetical protein
MSQVTETTLSLSTTSVAKERSLNNTTCRLSYDCLISATKSFVHNFSNLTTEEKLEYKSLTNYVKQLDKCVAVYRNSAQSVPRAKKVVKKDEQSPTAQAAQAVQAAQAAQVSVATIQPVTTSATTSSKKGKKTSSASSETAQATAATATATATATVAATETAATETVQASTQESKKGKKSAVVKTK